METVAVYYEEPVRTYGLMVMEDCLLLSLECSPDQLVGLTQYLAAPPSPMTRVFWNALWEGETAIVQVCLPQDQAHLLEQATELAQARLRGREEACVIALQGPHFGDRCGLAEKALTGLGDAGVTPLSLMGVTHTLRIALSPSDLQAALTSLSKHFAPPEGDHGG